MERAVAVIDGLIDELEEELNVIGLDSNIWTTFPITTIQRFGFILESILGYSELGDTVYKKIYDIGIVLRKSLLDPRTKLKGTKEFPCDLKWKIIANTDLELD